MAVGIRIKLPDITQEQFYTGTRLRSIPSRYKEFPVHEPSSPSLCSRQSLTTPDFDAIQVRVARPARNFEAVSAFYGTTLGLPVIASFGDHDGHDGVIFGLPDASRQLEILQTDNAVPAPTTEDQLILYFGSPERVEEVAARVRGGRSRAATRVEPLLGAERRRLFRRSRTATG